MDLAQHYATMRAAAAHRLALGQAELDPLLDDPANTRRGLTLLARLPAPVAAALAPVRAAFQAVEPAQYYYPASSLHLTVLTLISCQPGFALGAIEPAAYRALVGQVLQRAAPITLTFRGLTASPGALLLQGFPHGAALGQLREALREAFGAAGLRHTIDQRYRLHTAHVTFARFRRPLARPRRLLQVLRRYEQHGFGTVQLNELELVFNDWYQRAEHTTLLQKFSLPALGPGGPLVAAGA